MSSCSLVLINQFDYAFFLRCNKEGKIKRVQGTKQVHGVRTIDCTYDSFMGKSI